jgi:hypothetical protein
MPRTAATAQSAPIVLVSMPRSSVVSALPLVQKYPPGRWNCKGRLVWRCGKELRSAPLRRGAIDSTLDSDAASASIRNSLSVRPKPPAAFAAQPIA